MRPYQATHNMGTTPNSCPADDAGARIRREENQDQQSLTPTRAAVSRRHRTGVDRGAWATGPPNPTSLCGNTSNSGVIRPHTLFASRLIGDVCAAPMRCLGEDPLALRKTRRVSAGGR